jgi:signal recognition particle subunit SRP19
MPDKDKLVIWPLYFDAGRSRSEGRMVGIHDAIKEPTIDDLMTAALRSGLKPEIEREKKHPKTWADASGRILVQKSHPKSEILKRISKNLKGKKDFTKGGRS